MNKGKAAITKPDLLKTTVYALPACLIILSLFYYWFVVADRNNAFLYYHDMGTRVPDTSPFSFVTASRYWMSGLVASGFVLLIYFPLNLILFRTKKNYSPPDLKKVLLFSFPVITAGVPIITMTMNEPVLPFSQAVKVAIATLAGLAVVLKSAELARDRIFELILYGADGFAMGLAMLITTGWISNIDHLPAWRITIFLTVYVICFTILAITSVLYVWKKIESFPAKIFVFSLAIAYPFGAVFHYLAGTDGHYYISNSDNFFMRNMWIQMMIWIAGVLFIWGIAWLRNSGTRNPEQSL